MTTPHLPPTQMFALLKRYRDGAWGIWDVSPKPVQPLAHDAWQVCMPVMVVDPERYSIEALPDCD